MYSLITVYCHTKNAWDFSPYRFSAERFLEFTNDNIKGNLKDLSSPRVVERLCSLPTLFMYEKKQELSGWLGKVTNVRLDGTNVEVFFQVDKSRPIRWEALEPYARPLGIDPWESERTHWAVKDMDLEPMLSIAVPKPIRAFISYKWESPEHVEWVSKLAAALRARGIEAILDQWEVRYGESFTDYMQLNIAKADVILFVITPESVKAAEAPAGHGGPLKFEVQMMNARRMAEGTRIIGIYRSGDRPPLYLRDHRYADFRDDQRFQTAMDDLVRDLLGQSGPPPLFG